MSRSTMWLPMKPAPPVTTAAGFWLRSEVIEIALVTADKVIDHANGKALLDEQVHHVAADEAGATGDDRGRFLAPIGGDRDCSGDRRQGYRPRERQSPAR